MIDGKLAALSLPAESQLHHLKALGFSLLISLTEDHEGTPDTAAVIQQGMDHLRIPVRDFTAPTQEQIDQFVRAVCERIERGEKVAVHCRGGLGRTGTMIACYLVSTGCGPEEAVECVRRCRPGSIQTDEQERALRDYWRRLHGRGLPG